MKDLSSEIEVEFYSLALKAKADFGDYHENLVNRLTYISPKGFDFYGNRMQYWYKVLGMGYNKEGTLCLCGKTIYHVYHIISPEKLTVKVGDKYVETDRCQIGSVCIKNFDNELWEKYREEKLREQEGHCYYCKKHVKNLERHLNGITCKNNKQRYYKKIKKKISPVLARMVSDQKKKEKKRLKIIAQEKERERLALILKKKREEFLKTHKECLDCEEMIPKEPFWKVRCLKCYLKTKKKEKKIVFRDDD